MTSLQKWHESLKTDRESVYFSDIIGRTGAFWSTTRMAFLSNRRLVFVEESILSVSVQFAFIREIRGMRLIERRLKWVGVLGVVLLGISSYISLTGASEALPLPHSIQLRPDIVSGASGVVLLIAFFLYSERRLLLDVNGLSHPLSVRWQGNHERFLKFANDLTYHRSLWEDAGNDD